MPTYQPENFADLLKASQNELGDPNFTNLMDSLRGYETGKFFLRQKYLSLQSGPQIQFNLLMHHNEQARFVATTDKDSVGMKNGLVTGLLSWKKMTTNYSIYHEQIILNSGKSQINNLVTMARAQAMTALVQMFDEAIWSLPTENDPRAINSIPTWVPKSSSEPGFNGGVPVGYSGTTVANVNPSTYTRWKSYAGAYTAVTKLNLIKRMNDMARATMFKPSVEGLPVFGREKRLSYYTNDTVAGEFEDIMDTLNDNHGNELSKYGGVAQMFRRTEIESVPQLNADTTKPVYQLDLGCFGIVGNPKMWGKEFTQDHYPGQHNLSATMMDWLLNMICHNRRVQGVLSTGTTYP